METPTSQSCEHRTNLHSHLCQTSRSKKRSHDGTLRENTLSATHSDPETIAQNPKNVDPDGGTQENSTSELLSVSDSEQGQACSVEQDSVISEEFEEEAEDEETTRDLLLEALENIDELSCGSFATHGQLLKSFNPGLSVEGFGGIGLPLSEHEAQRLITVCHQAPLGKHVEAMADPTVQKIWSLNPTQYRIRNPSWQQTLDEIVTKVALGLGISSDGNGLEAELDTLLLCEKGSSNDQCLRYEPHIKGVSE